MLGNDLADTRQVKFEPIRSIPSKFFSIIAFSVQCGALSGCVAYAIGFYAIGDLPLVLGLLIAAFFGGVCGLFCAPIVSIFLIRRELAVLRAPIQWLTIVAITVLGYGLSDDRLIYLLMVAVGAFLGASFLLFLLTPRIYDSPGTCRRCGYDIRASLAFGRCPECGTDFELREQSQVDGKQRTNVLQSVFAFLLTHPNIPIVLGVVIIMVPHGFGDMRRTHREHLVIEAARRSIETVEPLNLFVAAKFDWDTVYIMPPYSTPAWIATKFGLVWPNANHINIGLNDRSNLFVFVQQQKVVEFLEIPCSIAIHKDSTQCPIKREEALFQFESGALMAGNHQSSQQLP